MSIAMDATCLQCQLRRNLELAGSLGTPEQTMEFARDLLRLQLEAPKDAASPWLSPGVAQLLHRHYGLEIDRYRQEKLDSNKLVLEAMPRIRELVEASENPVLAGLQFAILGNYLDFSALQGQISFEKFAQMLETAAQMQIDPAVFQTLCADLEQGKKLLYLTDNAGEIGFDRIFAEAIAKAYPNIEITFCVRGGPALNDATREDAAIVGIPFPVIDNGNLVPGTQLDLLGDEARQAMNDADVILAKGMANVETLFGSGYPIYYAFLVKCQRFEGLFHKPLMTPMLVREGQ